MISEKKEARHASNISMEDKNKLRGEKRDAVKKSSNQRLMFQMAHQVCIFPLTEALWLR